VDSKLTGNCILRDVGGTPYLAGYRRDRQAPILADLFQ